jgi:hypothetical protein
MIDDTAVFRRRNDIRYRIVGPEAVVIRQSGPEVLVLNGVGARVIDVIDARTTVAMLVTRLAEDYDVDRGTLERDVISFLQELADGGVIERVESSDVG